MGIHKIYAQIFNGRIENIMICDDYELANRLARSFYGNEAIAVECSQYPCTIGDGYRDGNFYRTINEVETIIEYVPTPEQEVERLNIENESLKDEITQLQLALTEQYEANINLQNDVTNTQIALTEIYEGMEALGNG